MAHLNYFLHILGMIFLQMCLVYSSCKNVKELKGTISNSYTVRGGSLYHRCWTLKNPDKNVIFIQLNNISLHNRPASKGVLTMKFLSDSKTVNVSSESQLGNFTTTSSVVEIHFKVNSAHFASGQKTSFSLYFSQDCNRILTELTGNLSSPHYPSSSPTDAQCIYRIRLTPGYLINITFQNIDIGLDDTCDKGNLQVYDGDDQESPLAAELCGVIASYPIISTNNYLWIKFKSFRLFGSSFSANYSAVKIFEMPTNIDEPEEVSEVITDNSEGNFQTSTTEDNLESRSNAQEECPCPTDQIVGMSTNIDGPKEEVTTDSSKQTSSPVDKLESTTMEKELPSCANGTKHSTIKDVMDIAVEEHRRRLEVIELQKRYEMDRIEFQKIFETEKLKQMKQYHNFKIRGAERRLSKDSFEE